MEEMPMGMPFNADEIFEMAEQIERNGARFYRRAAEGTAEQDTRQLLLDLAAMEDKHEKTFASMRAHLVGEGKSETVYDPEGQGALYLRAMADGYVFDTRADPTKFFTGNETMGDILQKAIGMEKDAIVFYLGMKELVPERLGKDKIDAIIREEMGHLGSLNGELAKIRHELS